MSEKRKDPAAVALGRKGGAARAANLTPKERSESARAAVEARWTGHVPAGNAGKTAKAKK